MSHWTNPMLLAGRRVEPSFQGLAALFSGGADGLMVDFTDPTLLFQDANGVLPVTTNGDPIGLAFDQHKWGGKTLAAYRITQPELMTNGNFSGGLTGWTLSFAGNVSITGNVVRITTDSSTDRYISRSFTTVIGKWYEVSVDFLAATLATDFRLYAGSSAGNSSVFNGGTMGVGATGRRYFRAIATATFITVANTGVTGNYTEFSNVSVKEIEGHHATQATAGSRPTWNGTDATLSNGPWMTSNDFYFQDKGNFLAGWARITNIGSLRTVAGVASTSGGTEYGAIYTQNATGVGVAWAGSLSTITGGSGLQNVLSTLLLEQNTTTSQLFVDGVSVSSLSSAGNMPDAARGFPLFIGARNNVGSATNPILGTIKRIVAGQVDLAAVMSAPDFHANLIA